MTRIGDDDHLGVVTCRLRLVVVGRYLAERNNVEDYGAFIAAKLGPLQRFPFPGGRTIGLIMLLNLTVAHVLKFRIKARDNKLAAGLGLTVLGLILTAAVVWTGNTQTGVEFGNTILTPETIWFLMLGGLALAGIAALVLAAMATAMDSSMSPLTRWMLGGIGVVFVAIPIAFLIGGEAARLNLSNMRILWQLLKGGACALVLLLGANLLFEKRGGIVVLHFGVALLMISELQVDMQAKENMLSLAEGDSTSFVRDIRVRELAIISQKDEQKDSVVVIPEARLETAAGSAAASKESKKPGDEFGGELSPNQIITLKDLPFDVAVRRFYRNSALRSRLPDDTMRTESGLGKFSVAKELPPVTGMQESNDTSAVYVVMPMRV